MRLIQMIAPDISAVPILGNRTAITFGQHRNYIISPGREKTGRVISPRPVRR